MSEFLADRTNEVEPDDVESARVAHLEYVDSDGERQYVMGPIHGVAHTGAPATLSVVVVDSQTGIEYEVTPNTPNKTVYSLGEEIYPVGEFVDLSFEPLETGT